MKTINLKYTHQKNSINVYAVSKLVALFLGSLILLTSCETADDVNIIRQIPDDIAQVFGGLEYDNSITEARENAIQNFTIDATTRGVCYRRRRH